MITYLTAGDGPSHQRLLAESKLQNNKFSHHDLNLNLEIIDELNCKDKIVYARILQNKYDEYDLYLLKSVELAGGHVVNSSEVLRVCGNKLAFYYYFKNSKIKTIDTYWTRSDNLNAFVKALPDFQNGHVCKFERGLRGVGVQFCSSKESLLSMLETFWAMGDKKFIIQPRLEIISETRVIKVYDEFLGSLKKTKSFKNNDRHHPQYSFNKEIDEKHIEIIQAFDKELPGGNILAYDFIQLENGELLLSEVNANFGFIAFERESGINVASKIVSSIGS